MIKLLSSLPGVAASFGSHWLTKMAVSAGSALIAWMFPDRLLIQLLWMLLASIAVDTLTGVRAVRRAGQPLTKEGWMRVLNKILYYFAILFVAAVAGYTFSIVAELNGITAGPRTLVVFMAGTLAYMICTELWSINDNCKRLGYKSPPFIQKLLTVLKKIVVGTTVDQIISSAEEARTRRPAAEEAES